MPTEKSQDNKIRVGGTRPRPRVALLGGFAPTSLKRYKQLFPTTYLVRDLYSLSQKASWSELDLLIIGPEKEIATYQMGNFINLVYSVHVICFSENIPSLPGPTPHTWISMSKNVDTEEYLLPEISLPYHRRREADFAKIDNVKGWPLLKIKITQDDFPAKNKEVTIAKSKITSSAIILDRHTGYPFATIYLREGSSLGVAWLPQSFFDQVSWAELIVTEWAKSDPVRFPEFGDWTKLPEWMVPKEEEIAQKISALEDKKQNTIQQIDKEIGSLQSDLTETTLAANEGVRRLLTAQGDELVDEVANIFSNIGFEVQLMDKKLEDNKPKREDLRLQDPSVQEEDWEAIVEVRGYKKSDGKTGDLTRLVSRFTNLYFQEKNRFPDKKIYVVNGQLDIANPSQRRAPLVSAKEDIEIFAEENGIIISTIDLFHLAKNLHHLDHSAARESMKTAKGRWTIKSVHQSIKSSSTKKDQNGQGKSVTTP